MGKLGVPTQQYFYALIWIHQISFLFTSLKEAVARLTSDSFERGGIEEEGLFFVTQLFLSRKDSNYYTCFVLFIISFYYHF